LRQKVECPSKYNRWSSEDRRVIRENYLKKSNTEIAKLLKRTPESVRKEFEKLGLKRPTKSQIPKQPKKRGRKPREKNVFDAIQDGINEKKHIEREQKRLEQRKKRMLQEAAWAASFVKGEDNTRKIEFKSPNLCDMRSVRADDRTVFFFSPGATEKRINSRISAYKDKWCSH
jgi:hypothetical protein